jgi:hypothetical protein
MGQSNAPTRNSRRVCVAGARPQPAGAGLTRSVWVCQVPGRNTTPQNGQRSSLHDTALRQLKQVAMPSNAKVTDVLRGEASKQPDAARRRC